MIKDHDYLFKIVIVGNQGVGKSSLFLRYCDSNFAENYLPTIGVDFRFKMVKVNGNDCKLQIWDTAGQQRFRTLTSAYYRGSQAIIIVYDVTDSDSFKQIESYWLHEAKNNTQSNTNIYIVGNKSDKFFEVNDVEVQAFSDKYGLKSYFISAKTGDKVEQMFNQICEQLIQKQKAKPKKKQNNIVVSHIEQEEPNPRKKCCG